MRTSITRGLEQGKEGGDNQESQGSQTGAKPGFEVRQLTAARMRSGGGQMNQILIGGVKGERNRKRFEEPEQRQKAREKLKSQGQWSVGTIEKIDGRKGKRNR